MARKTKGRGWLSSIDLLPAEASDIVVWAARELADHGRTLTDIYAEFRQKLIALQGEQGLDFAIPAFASFHRHSVRQAELARRLQETREISSNLADRLDGVANEDLTLLIIETLKSAMFEVLSRNGDAGTKPKELMELARAIQSLVATTKMSAAQRAAVQEKVDAAAEEAVDKAETVMREAGVSKDAIAQLRREFLGLRPKIDEAAK